MAVHQTLVRTTSLVACDNGGTLIMKLLGFMEDQEAQLLDVTEDHLRLRVGRAWWERWWHGMNGHAPLEIRLDIRRAPGEDLPPHQRTQASQSRIDVAVRPLSRTWKPDPFQSAAERLMHRLRWHLMVG